MTTLHTWLESLDPAVPFEALASLFSDAAIFVVDAQQRIVYWSPGAESLLGFSAASVSGQHCLEANRCHACFSGCGLRQHHALKDIPLVLHDAQDKAIALRKSARAFFDEEGRFAGGIELLKPEHLTTLAPTPSLDDRVHHFHGFITRNPELIIRLQELERAAQGSAPLWIAGEPGTGKSCLAEAAHAASGREPRVVLSGRPQPSLAHVSACIEQARGGSLILNDPDTALLTRALDAPPEVRLIVTSQQRPQHASRWTTLSIPPLRENSHDLELLLWRAIDRNNAQSQRIIRSLELSALARLKAHTWPNNVKELERCIQHVFRAHTHTGEVLRRSDLPRTLLELSDPEHSDVSITRGRARLTEDEERKLLLEALDAAEGHIGRAAERLGMSRPTFWRHRKRLGV